MKSNWEEITIEILSGHVGALAEIIVDEARANCRCSPTTESQSFLTEFVVFISQELPESIDRASVAIQLRNALK